MRYILPVCTVLDTNLPYKVLANDMICVHQIMCMKWCSWSLKLWSQFTCNVQWFTQRPHKMPFFFTHFDDFFFSWANIYLASYVSYPIFWANNINILRTTNKEFLVSVVAHYQVIGHIDNIELQYVVNIVVLLYRCWQGIIYVMVFCTISIFGEEHGSVAKTTYLKHNTTT